MIGSSLAGVPKRYNSTGNTELYGDLEVDSIREKKVLYKKITGYSKL